MRARRSAGYLIMSNAGASLSLRGLGDATSVPIAWTSTAPRIKNGPPAAAAVSSSFSNRSPITLLLLCLRLSRTRNKTPGNRQEIQKQNCEKRGWEREEEEKKRQQWRWEAAPGPNRGFICCALPAVPSSMAHQSPFCHRSSFPQTAPARGVAVW